METAFFVKKEGKFLDVGTGEWMEQKEKASRFFDQSSAEHMADFITGYGDYKVVEEWEKDI